LEAAAAGASMVLGNTWGAEEYFGSQARYVNPSSVPEIRAAIEACLAHPPDREKQKEYFAAHFSWEAVAQKLQSEYKAILAE
ncbi:MAG: hypothetical protein JWN14_2905, partial [Chthonomonadales bacterium]|nr:hypothetical protein [Chthonomonadales bacterium]